MLELSDGLMLDLDAKTLTARVVCSKKLKGDIFIPTFITHKSKEYFITSICENAFRECNINSVTFSNNSQLSSIRINAFCFSSIQLLVIPESVDTIDDGSFNFVNSLINVIISPQKKTLLILMMIIK